MDFGKLNIDPSIIRNQMIAMDSLRTMTTPPKFETYPQKQYELQQQQYAQQQEQNESLKIAVQKLEAQNELLLQNYNRLNESYDLQKQQLDEAKTQNNLLLEKLLNEQAEKDKMIKAEKRNKPWSIAGKILAGVIGFVTFSIGIAATLYTEQCKEAIDAIIKIFLTQG